MKLAIVTTHPIQYYAPLFKLLALQCELKVFYTWGKDAIEPKLDTDFGKVIKWDIPLLAGYEYEFLKNISKNPGSHHFLGIKNPKITERISCFKPDAILVYGWSYESHLKVLRHFKNKIPIWFRGDSTMLATISPIKRIIRKLLLTWVYHHVEKAFYVGSENKRYYKEYGLKEHQLIWAPHAIDNERFATAKNAEVSAFRKNLGIDEQTILILFAGKFQSQKNPELLLNAFEKLGSVSAHLLYVGNGKLEKSLKELVAISSVKDRISFIDFQNQQQMPIVYQSCDLYCLCSRSETWGLAVNEAMAAGKAILVSDKVGCAVDLIEEGVNGYTFKSEDELNLLQNLRVMLDKDKLAQMGKESQCKIKIWSLEKQAEYIANLWK